jgi:lysophospholipase L1-like esterase
LNSQWGHDLRVLAVGGAPVAGEGLRGPRLGLPGRLAEELSNELGREVRVDAVGDRTLTLTAAVDALTADQVAGADVLLVTLGTTEALRRVRPNLWRRRMTALLERLDALTGPSTRVVLVGIPAVQSLPDSGRGELAPARAHARRLNRITRRLCRSYGQMSFVRLPRSGGRMELHPAPETYWRWATFLAPQIAKRLPASPTPAQATADRTLARVADRLGGMPHDGSERLLRLVSHARLSFGTRFAALALPGSDGSWRYWSMGWDADDAAVPVHTTTMESEAADVVTDARAQVRFRDLNTALEEHVGFFAGARVQWAGVPVGALYVFDTAHRSGGRLDEKLLWSLARLVEQELRTLVPERHALGEALRPLVGEVADQALGAHGQLALSH